MALALIAAVIVLPIVELMVLFKIGNAIGLLPLLFLLVAMALIGGLVLRRQGMVVARRALEQVSRNEPPVESMIDGIGLSLAGFLFILPGLLSDVAGLLLLVPAIRRPVVGRVLGLAVARWQPRGSGRGPGDPGGRPGAPFRLDRAVPIAPSRSGVIICGWSSDRPECRDRVEWFALPGARTRRR